MSPPASPLPPTHQRLDAALAAAEIHAYRSTVGLIECAEQLEAEAREAGLVSRVRRARLLRGDVLSRQGRVKEALRIQVEVLAEAEADGDRLACARAHCVLATTYDRLADPPKSQAAAAAAVQLLEPGDPLQWHAEHLMMLALFTSTRRRGAVDWTTFEEAVRLAREAGPPLLLLAVLNNYTWVSLELEDPRALGLAEEMQRLIAEELAGAAPAVMLDTIAVALLRAQRLEEAAVLAEEAVVRAPQEISEPHAASACLLTAAGIDRARGRLEAARARLEEARRLALKAPAVEVAALALRALSELAAQQGDYQAAYVLLDQYLDEWDAYQTERSELHAATIQAIYGAEVERKRRVAVERLADTDPLTGLWNRRYLDRRLAELIGAPIVLALLDLDHFKQINDRFSHDAGDAVLRRVAEVLELHVQTHREAGAFAARLGGEEFILVLPGRDPGVAYRLCERIRTQLHATEWVTITCELEVTASIGMAVDLTASATGSELLARADAALYEAKRRGRNRVVSDDDARLAAA